MTRHDRWSGVGIFLVLLAGCGPKKPPVPPEPTETQTEDSADETPAQNEPASAPKSFQEEINEAADLVQAGDRGSLQQAIGRLEDIIRRNPDVAEAHLNLGVALQRSGQLQDARRAYQAALNIKPGLGLGWLYLGLIQEEQGRMEQAITNYRTGIRNDPENMSIRVAMVDVLRLQGRLDDAIAQAKDALRVNARALGVYNALGQVYLEKEELTLAQFVYQKALTLEGAREDPYVVCNYGWVLYAKGEKYAAEFQLKEALKLDPELVPGLVYLSKLYMEDRNYEDTIGLLETAAKLDPENHGVQLNLGVAYRGMDRFPEAEKAYRKALTIDPGDPRPHLNLGILYGDYLKEYDKALDSYKEYLSGGGSEADVVNEYIVKTEKEKKRADKRKKAEEARKKREAERAERQRLLEEEEKKKQAEQDAWGDQPVEEPTTVEPTPETVPEPQPQPQPEPSSDGGEVWR